MKFHFFQHFRVYMNDRYNFSTIPIRYAIQSYRLRREDEPDFLFGIDLEFSKI